MKTIGIVDWYDIEKGYGVILNTHDHRNYFVHHSQLKGQYKQLIKKEDILLFTPDYDQKRNREIASNIHYFSKSQDVQFAINRWMEGTLLDANLGQIIRSYLNNYDKKESSSIKDAYNRLIDVIIPYMESEVRIKDLYSLLNKGIGSAFDQEKASKLLELTDYILIEKLPSNIFALLLDSGIPPYSSFVFALNDTDYTEYAVQKAFDNANETSQLLDDLIRFTKDINEEDVKDSLEKEKSLITNDCFWIGIVGENILSIVNRIIFSNFDESQLKELIKKGYIRHVDNPILKKEHPDYYKNLMLYASKKGLADTIDISFVEENIGQYSASELINLKEFYQLADEVFSNLLLRYIRNLLINKQKSSYKEILLFSQEIPELHKWITDNQSFLANNAVEEYNELLILLYKSNKVLDIDMGFILYFIDKFSINEIVKIISGEQVIGSQRERILSALFKDILSKPSYDRISKLEAISNHAKSLFNERYPSWFGEVLNDIDDESKYMLWKNKISEYYPESYIRENLLTSDEKGYHEFHELYQRGLITIITASNTLWEVLNENKEVHDRPTFYKILYCIKYLLTINPSYKEAIEIARNEYYNLILWFLSYSNSLEFDYLCRLFIYFLPNDQVRIVKRLFYLAEDNQLSLSIEMLNSLLRVDADLYKLISRQHPEIPIDVSSEIVIKSLVKLSETGNFSTDKEVLGIIVSAGQYNKNEKFKIGSYFDECRGRRVYEWDGYKAKRGLIKIINNDYFAVFVYAYINERRYERGLGYHDASVWNDQFHNIVDAIKTIPGRRWNSDNSYWEVPSERKIELMNIAKEYGLEVEGTRNSHMNRYRINDEGKPERVDYCEGRPAPLENELLEDGFLWCRNSKCYRECVKEHSKEEWQDYTLLDFCRILELDVDAFDSLHRFVKYGKYLSFASLINRANAIIEHLYCRECGEMLEPAEISDYYTHLVTHFHCTNPSCKKMNERIYISKCFNWKCNGVIDDRDTKKCPNGWNICPECGSCCSNRIAQQRIDNNKELGIRPRPYFIDFINNRRGHLEKREFYCYKCETIMNNIGDNVFECPNCRGVRYDRKLYDFEPRQTTVSS